MRWFGTKRQELRHWARRLRGGPLGLLREALLSGGLLPGPPGLRLREGGAVLPKPRPLGAAAVVVLLHRDPAQAQRQAVQR